MAVTRTAPKTEEAMAYWLFKTEPGEWSWDDQVKAGAKGSEWTGVRNPVARNNMKAMKKGDRGFFYHTGDQKRIIGIVEVVKEARPDSGDPAWLAVDVAAVAPLKTPVTLAAVKAEPKLAEMTLARQPRLSVQPVRDAEWKLVSRMGGV
jgi:predicted RNA-binding protein with PUA-like domain